MRGPTFLGRRRRVELARETSDVLYFRGLGSAAAAGGFALVMALLLIEGPDKATAPGLTRPHQATACSSCHASGTVADACANCHGEHASRRAGHRRLAASGQLVCSNCHPIHRDAAGLSFESDGRVFLYGAGFQHELSPLGPAQIESPRPPEPALVPLVRASACADCHDRDNPRDPAAHCLTKRGQNSGAGGFALCFDEHRESGTATLAQPAERDAVVEAARHLAQTGSLRSARLIATTGSSALYVLFGLGVTLGVVSLARRRSSQKRAPPREPATLNAVRRLPVIDPTRCLGCEACVDACPYDVLEVRRYVAVLARPDDCCGAGPCQESCPNGSLTLRSEEVPVRGPQLSDDLECPEHRGLFLAGDVSGSSLIRNAVRQGVKVAETIAGRRAARSREAGVFDLIVVGAGPAGLAAGLTAKARGLSVLVLEQASIAESIRRFSRGKLVLDAGAGEPAQLPLFIADAPKEELLRRWQRAVRTAGLDVREGSRVIRVDVPSESLERHFRVAVEGESDGGAVASHVLLAVGARGTPRKLPVPVPETLEGRVHYELSDARAFAGRRVIVVGLGDVAMETALALAGQAGTEVSLVHRGSGFRRGKQRNIDALSGLVARGRVKIWFQGSVEGFESGALLVATRGETRRLPFDAVFVHIGSVPAEELLRGAGVCLRE